jgi:lipopolysaccharide/colanic/teichoic acid biosynthesis glycosyltransferase
MITKQKQNKAIRWIAIAMFILMPFPLLVVYNQASDFVFKNYDFSTKLPSEIVRTYFYLPMFLLELISVFVLLFVLVAILVMYAKLGAGIFKDETYVGSGVKK